jgi:hypothetical protein
MTIRSTSTTIFPWLAAALAVPAVLAACGSTPPEGTGGGGSGSTTTTSSSTTTTGTAGSGGTAPTSLTVERWGTRIWGPILAVSRTDRALWLGTRSVVDPDDASVVHGGLTRLDLDTGEVKVFESELPHVQEDFGNGPMESPVPTAGVIADGARKLVVARTGLLILDAQDTITEKAIALPGGGDAAPTGIVLDRNAGRARIWASTEAGLVRMHADTFAVEKVFGSAELGSTNVGSLALDPESGAVYLAVYEDDGTSRLARVDDAGVTKLTPGHGGAPTGTVGDVVWSTKAKAAIVAIGAWNSTGGGVVTWDGSSVTMLAAEADLGEAAHGAKGAFGPLHLAVDDGEGIVVVGGSIRPTPPFGYLAGGGLAWIELATKRVAGISTGTTALPGDDIGALTYDPATRRTYVAARQPCNEVQLGNVGLLAVSFRDDGSARFERPILSGVRSMAVVGSDVYLGLRDETPGLSCYGYAVQTGLVKLEANRAGEIVPLASTSSDGILPNAGPTAMSVDDKGRFAIGTLRDGTLVGDPTGGYVWNQALTPGVSLYELDIAWAGADTVWIAGSGTHDPSDPPSLADAGPRGAARVTFSGEKPSTFEHFVLASSDAKDVTGLPSSEVAAIAIGASEDAFLACATERFSVHATDRELGDPFSLGGKVRAGGVAKVGKDGAITVLATSEVAPDPRGIALDPAGNPWVLDAQKGLLRFENGAFVAAQLPDGAPAGAYPHGLWLGAGQDLAALYDKGAVVSLAGQATFVGDAGHAWRAVKRAEGVILIGTDRGLVRARIAASDVAEKAVTKGALPAFAN